MFFRIQSYVKCDFYINVILYLVQCKLLRNLIPSDAVNDNGILFILVLTQGNLDTAFKFGE